MVDKLSNVQIFVESLTVIIANTYSLPVLSVKMKGLYLSVLGMRRCVGLQVFLTD